MMNNEDTLESLFGLSTWEQQCVDEHEKTSDFDNELQNAKDIAVQRLWFLFQNAATNITQLYKEKDAITQATRAFMTSIDRYRNTLNTVSGSRDYNKQGISRVKTGDRSTGDSDWSSYNEDLRRLTDSDYDSEENSVSLWVPFQTAASSVTSLYKECIESHKPVYEMGFQTGNQRRNKELLSWVKKKKRNIRREDLIAYITGKTPPAPRFGCPRPRLVLDGMHNSSHLAHSHRFNQSDATGLLTPRTENLDFFREALANRRQHNPGSPTGLSRVNRARHCNSTSTNHNELSAFIAEEFSRHSRKRSPSVDVIMDSPTHKRARYYD